VARDRHSAVFVSPKAVRGSRDRGCNGHRILRRVLADGRHPGSSRGVGFHEKASTVVLADSAPSDPCQTSQKEDTRPGCSRREGARGVRVFERSSRQGCQRLDRIECRGKKTPTLVSPGREAVELEVTCSTTIRRSGLGCRETSGPSVIPHGALVSVGRPRGESRESEPGTREVRVHTVRMGGRYRLDASRVFSTGRPQGLLVTTRGR